MLYILSFLYFPLKFLKNRLFAYSAGWFWKEMEGAVTPRSNARSVIIAAIFVHETRAEWAFVPWNDDMSMEVNLRRVCVSTIQTEHVTYRGNRVKRRGEGTVKERAKERGRERANRSINQLFLQQNTKYFINPTEEKLSVTVPLSIGW